MTNKMIIGWSEHVSLPDWGIENIKAKVDTGARSSALHVENLRQERDGWVTFEVVTHRSKSDLRKQVRARAVKWGRVRSSSGDYANRCFVRTTIQIGAIRKEIELSLVSRVEMLFRMLIGRKALEHDFIVDVSRRNVLTAKPKRRIKRKATGS